MLAPLSLLLLLLASAQALFNAPASLYSLSSRNTPFRPYSLTLPALSLRPVEVGAPLDLYVDVSGSDNNPGSPAQPFRTVHRARDYIRTLSRLPSGGVTVHVGSGLFDSLQLTQQDSGSPGSPITYVGTGNTLLSAGVAVPAQLWAEVSVNTTALRTFRLDLKALNISDYGAMQTGGLGDCQHDKLELFYQQRSMVLARYPNILPNGTWAYVPVTGVPNASSVTMKVEGNRPAIWMREQSPWLHGYFAFDWYDMYAPLTAVDVRVLSATLYSSVALGAQASGRFYAVNMFCELDAPGEYYVTADGMLYFITPDQQAPDGSGVVSVGENVLQASNVAYVTLQGLAFAHARKDGVVFNGVHNVTLNACNFSLNGGGGAVLEGVDSSILNSEAADVGCAGLTVMGGDVPTLTPASLLVDGNRVHHYGRWKRTYMPGVLWRGVGILVSNNYIAHAPHNGILGGGNEGGGNYATFEYNTIDSVCQDTSDAGAFYTCGQQGTGWTSRGNIVRHNIFRNIRNNEGGQRGGLAVNAIYLDDQTSGYTIYNNTFADSVCGVMVGGGRDHAVFNNYFQHCDLAVHIDNRGSNWQAADAKFPHGILWSGVAGSKPFEEPWASAFPRLWNLSYCGVPVFNSVYGNAFCNNSKDEDFVAKAKEWLVSYHDNVQHCGGPGM